MGRNVNNIKSINLLFPNCLSQVWGGSEPPLTHNNVVCAYLFNKLSQEKIFPYCVSSGVSGLCPDGIRLEIFKRCNENLLCRSEQKFSLQSFKISFNSAGFSFLWFISFLLPAQYKRKEMNIIESHFEHSSYLKQESTCQIKHSKLL